MAKIKKLFKALLCACMLLGGMMIKPMETKAEETVTPYAAAREITLDGLYWFNVEATDYSTNYLPVYVSGTYVYNTASTGNYITNVDLSFTPASDNSYLYPYTTSAAGIYEVVTFVPQSYSAISNYGIKINYKTYLRKTSGTNLGTYTNFKNITP